MNEPEAGQNMEKKCPQCGASLPSGTLEGLCPACLLKQGAAPETAAAQAVPFVAPSVEEVARLFPQLEIISILGRGGMGAVYKARQPMLDRLVALKILPPQAAGGPGFTDRFNREARALARLNHPNIVVIYEFGQVNGLPFFIMEFVDGLNLRQLEHAARLPSGEALAIIPQICEALQFAHDAGVVHRDIKPENILLDKTGRVKIADFGIAKMVGGESTELGITGTKQAIGTPHYMAPEQVEKPETVDHRADIYSLGVVFYEMLTGELPLGKFGPPSSRVRVDVRLDEVVLRALEKEPELRYQQANEVRTRLETIAKAPAPAPPVDAEAVAKEILARDFSVSIRNCLRRGWNLVWKDFWPTVGITAVILLLASGANFLSGPLMGGLWLYYLNKVRGKEAGIDTALSGFRVAFLQLFLAGLLTSLLTVLGFFCFVLPGIYLLVAWMFAVPLLADKGLNFWPAMELSRRTINKHWFKLLGLLLTLLLVGAVGWCLLFVGIFITAPFALAAAAYAYEDIFGRAKQAAEGGPFGTTVMPAKPTNVSNAGVGIGRPVAVGLAALMTIFGLIVITVFLHRARSQPARNDFDFQGGFEFAGGITNYTFGRVVQRIVNDPDDDMRNSCLDLDSGKQSDMAIPWPDATASNEAFTNAWATLTPVAIQQGIDVVGHASERSIEVFLAGAVSASSDDFDAITAEEVVQNEELSRRATQVESEQTGETLTIDNPPATYLFKTRAGNFGLMQISGFTDAPRGVKIRYKLVESRVDAVSIEARRHSRDDLAARLEAAVTINMPSEKDSALAQVAADAAKGGEVTILRRALGQITNPTQRDDVAHESTRLLSKQGLRRQAIDVARTIINPTRRDQTMSELAH
jgi:serine/threonine protein kinase